MSHQITKVDLIPNGELSVCNVSQFDNGRVLPFEILENKEAYNIPNDIRVELHCRKPDGNIVTLPSESISNNIVTFLSTTQLTACYGKNVCEIALYGPDDFLIGSCNFILDVEKSPTLGGINSTSAIHNLESQIRDIAEDVIPEIIPEYLDNYYTKSEVDSALALKANAADVYTKEQTYTQTEVNALIDNIFPTFTAFGGIASFITALTKPLVSVTTAVGATTVTRCGVNLFDKAEVYEGYINDANGEFRPNVNYKATGFIAVKGGLDYYIKSEQNSANWGAWYDINKNYIEPLTLYANRTKTAPVNACYARLTIVDYDNGSGNPDTFGVNYPATNTTYHTYNGQTVPVSDATILVTQSGINNVFADVGDLTVGYKYMPMPETPTNSNRLALSSVNSDIIKEKSEIEEQSDIVEDIERGDKNE